MKNSMKLFSVLAVYLLLLTSTFTGCKDKDDPVYDPPTVTVDGPSSIAALAADVEVTITFNVSAPAGIKSVSYMLDGMITGYTSVSLGSETLTEMSVPIKFTAKQGLTAVSVKAVDKQDRQDEATVTIGKIANGPGIFFVDDINSVDVVNAGEQLEVSGSVVAAADLTELFYTPFVNGVAQPREDIPIGDNKQVVSFTVAAEVVSGLQKLEFTAIDELGSTVKEVFTIESVRDLKIEMDPASSKAWMRGETGVIKGRVLGTGITGARYYIVKNKTEDAAVTISLGANNTFEFSVNADEYISAVRIVASTATDTEEEIWPAHVCGNLKELKDITLTMERYEDDKRSFFCAWKEPHVFHGSEMCATPENYVDWWDFSVYQRAGASANENDGRPFGIITLASPAAWPKNVQNANRIAGQVVPNVNGPNGDPCRGAPSTPWTRPEGVSNPSWNSAAAYMKIPRLNYTMISQVRPELAGEFDRVQTEADLWILLDKYVESEGKTIREIWNPVTSSNCHGDNYFENEAAEGVYWIAWGPYNGTVKGGEKGNPAQNGGLGLIRMKWRSPIGNAAKQITFDIKFPEWPNYRELFNDSWVDIRECTLLSGDMQAAFPVEFDFPGWPVWP